MNEKEVVTSAKPCTATSVVPTDDAGAVNLAQEPGTTIPSPTRKKKEPKKTSSSTTSTTSASPTLPERSPQLPKAATSPKVVVPSTGTPSPKLQRHNSHPDLPSETPESPTPQKSNTPKSPRKHKKEKARDGEKGKEKERDDRGKGIEKSQTRDEVTKDEADTVPSSENSYKFSPTSFPALQHKSASSLQREEIPRLRLLQKRPRKKSKTHWQEMEGISAITADEEAVFSQIEENLSYGIYDSDSASKSPDVDVDIDVAFKRQNAPDKKRYSVEVSSNS